MKFHIVLYLPSTNAFVLMKIQHLYCHMDEKIDDRILRGLHNIISIKGASAL